MFREAGSSSGEAGLPEASCDIYFPTLNPWVPPLRLSTPRTPLIPHVSLCLGFVLWRRFLKHSHLPQVSLFFLQKASGEEDMQLASPGGLLGRCSAPLSNAHETYTHLTNFGEGRGVPEQLFNHLSPLHPFQN